MAVKASSTDTPVGRIHGFVALERQVQNLERSVDFYVRGLGFAVEAPCGAIASLADSRERKVLRLGDERVVLRLAQKGAGVAPRVAGTDVRFQHAAIVTCDMPAAFARLQTLAPASITQGGPQRLPPASGGATAFKFRDPDGHPLELIAFADCPDRWCDRAGHALTLGIDHSAISVCDAARSIDFYSRLGLEVEARQVNCGPEQARLDGLECADDVEVEVIALRPGSTTGFHLELLAYRAPPAINLATRNLLTADSWEDRLIWRGNVSPSFLADPDGHLLRVII